MSRLLWLAWLVLPRVSCCYGGTQYSTIAARNRALAYASKSLDADFHRAKCASEDFGFYRARELKKLATEYGFNATSINMDAGGSAICGFDSEQEKCAWYNKQVGLEGPGFRRARFESFFDVDKFECTSERIFAFEDFFLMAGGQDYGHDISAALEMRVPCQFDVAFLKFDYWSNNETPVLKICVIPEDQPDPQCEESHMDANPLTFEIPQSLKPFRLRIQVDNIGQDEIVFVDSVRYEGKLCEVFQKSVRKSSPIKDNGLGLGSEEEAGERAASKSKKKAVGITSVVNSEDRELGRVNNKLDVCEALSCDFNHGDSCFYSLSGLGGTAEWRVGEKYLGNPHTGIHKPNPIDLKMTGFAFVGLDGNDFLDEVFVMESTRFYTKEPVYLVFDLYQRSVGPQLRVCVNSFDNCPYVNPPLNAHEFWRPDQRILLDESAEKVFFIAGKVGRNLYLAVDNIRVQSTALDDFCTDLVR